MLQDLVDLADKAADLFGFRALAKAGNALVQEPQTELGACQWLEGGVVALAGQRVEQGVFPVQQQCALAFPFGPHVLHQREQPVGRVGAGGALAGVGIGQRHRFQCDVERGGKADAGRMRDFAVAGLREDELEQPLLEHTGAARHQIHRNAHPCMHVADHTLGGNQRFHLFRRGPQQVGNPALHGRLQAGTHLLMRQQTRRALVIHHHLVEVQRHVHRAGIGQAGQQLHGCRTAFAQAVLPGRNKGGVAGIGGISGFGGKRGAGHDGSAWQLESGSRYRLEGA